MNFNVNSESKIVLKLEIEKKTFIGHVTYEVKQKRDDLLIILKFLDEIGPSQANIHNIQKRLLHAIPLIGIKRLVQRLHDLDLIQFLPSQSIQQIHEDTPIMLTEKGKNSILNQELYLPAEDNLKISIVEHPLFPQFLYHVEKIEELPRKFRRSNDSIKFADLNKEFTSDVLDTIYNNNSIPLIRPFKDGEIILKKIDDKITPPEKSFLTIEIQISNQGDINMSITDNELKIRNERLELPQSLVSDLQYSSVLSQIIKQDNKTDWHVSHDNTIPYLLLSYSKVNPAERSSFRKQEYKLTSLIISPLGHIKSVILENYPIQPLNLNEAKQWYHELLTQKIDNYTVEQEFSIITHELLENFPLHKNDLLNTVPLSPIKFAASLFDHRFKETFRPIFWYLIAPIDLKKVD